MAIDRLGARNDAPIRFGAMDWLINWRLSRAGDMAEAPPPPNAP